MKEIQILTGWKGMIIYNLSLSWAYSGIHFKMFDTTATPRNKTNTEYIEYTPFNKGNIIKFRVYWYNKKLVFDVYKGTKKVAYCSSIESLYKTIKQLTT